jgi:arylsulfatase A-like enzyme
MRLLAGLCFAAIFSVALPALAQDKPPNVVFITVDTLRADHLSSWGYHLKTSPNIDKLASQGMRYENAYTVTSRTAPSHYSMFTSRYPQEHGSKLNGFAVPENTKFLFLPQIFQKNGYENAAFVSSWVVTDRLTKLGRFFDVYDDALNRQYQTINSMRWAEDVAPKAISWLRQKKDQQKPFFLWVHLFDPHSPYELRAEFDPTEKTGAPDLTKAKGQDAVMSNVRAYNSEIRYTDHYIGKIVDAVDEVGLGEDTLIVLVADHGESLGENNTDQGHGAWLWESVVRVPMILRWTGTIKPSVETARVSTIDLMPTILDLTIKRSKPDVVIPTEYAGRSLSDSLFTGADLPDRIVRFVAFAGQKWIMPKWFARLWLGDLDFPLRFGYRRGDRKVLWTPGKDTIDIVNLGRDPFGMHPTSPVEGTPQYENEAESLSNWFRATHLEQSGENLRTDKDIEALESLGYIQ